MSVTGAQKSEEYSTFSQVNRNIFFSCLFTWNTELYRKKGRNPVFVSAMSVHNDVNTGRLEFFDKC